jgi:hypothetical protein
MLFDHGVEHLIDLYLADSDLAVFQHRLRTCVYQEAGVCLQRNLDDRERIWQQICRYTREGYPANAGLAECSVILRRHTAAVRAFNEEWWSEISRGSRRDQLSFDYTARKLGLRYGLFPGTLADTHLFHRHRHAADGDAEAAPPHVHPVGRRNGSRGVSRDAYAREPGSPAAHNAVEPRCYRSVALPRRRTRKTIAFGRMRDKPSWSWAGFDVARELSRDYDVVIYDRAYEPPDCDVVFAIKKRPADSFLAAARRRGTKLVYCPIDVYRSAEEIECDAELLGSCAMVLVHCERLLPLVRRCGGRAQFIEHHSRFALSEMADYHERGYVLWIGSCQYVPYLARWLERHPLAFEVRLLTDIDNAAARAKAQEHAAEIGMEFVVPADTASIAGCRVHRWSERRQRDMMRVCRAAIDIKMTEVFNQHYKPPTKAQQYVASGIPFAVNPESYSAEYFRVRGFEVASPLDTERWLSREYWQATRVAAQRLRAETSLASVAARYRELIESL